MGRTIIQPIGPLYGEAVNGTVFGRPNGSIYIPQSNTIVLNVADNSRYVAKTGNNFNVTKSDGTVPAAAYSIIAQSQDAASYINIGLYSDADAETLVTGGLQAAERNLSAGYFNYTSSFLFNKSTITLTEGTTYYLKATLYSASGVAVAVSDIIELEAL